MVTLSAGDLHRLQTDPAVVKVGPKGYIHGWIFVGAPGVGDKVSHPKHGMGTVTAHDGKHVTVKFHSGATRKFEAREGKGTGTLQQRGKHDAMLADRVAQDPKSIKGLNDGELRGAQAKVKDWEATARTSGKRADVERAAAGHEEISRAARQVGQNDVADEHEKAAAALREAFPAGKRVAKPRAPKPSAEPKAPESAPLEEYHPAHGAPANSANIAARFPSRETHEAAAKDFEDAGLPKDAAFQRKQGEAAEAARSSRGDSGVRLMSNNELREQLRPGANGKPRTNSVQRNMRQVLQTEQTRRNTVGGTTPKEAQQFANAAVRDPNTARDLTPAQARAAMEEMMAAAQRTGTQNFAKHIQDAIDALRKRAGKLLGHEAPPAAA